MMELTEQFAYKYNQIQWTGVGDADVYQLRSGQTKLLHSCPSNTSSRKPHHVREDINGKKRFLSGIARMMGGGSTHARIFGPLF